MEVQKNNLLIKIADLNASISEFKLSNYLLKDSLTVCLKNIIELETLSLLLYIELKETHYKKTLEQGFDTLDFKLKDERVELLLMQN